MDWQQAVSLVVVGCAALGLLRNLMTKKKRQGLSGCPAGCSCAAPTEIRAGGGQDRHLP
jgi:hypothetical protein